MAIPAKAQIDIRLWCVRRYLLRLMHAIALADRRVRRELDELIAHSRELESMVRKHGI